MAETDFKSGSVNCLIHLFFFNFNLGQEIELKSSAMILFNTEELTI